MSNIASRVAALPVARAAGAKAPSTRFWRNGELVAAFAEGALLALAVLSVVVTLWPITRAPSAYPDSGNVLSISRTLTTHGIGTVWHTQSPIIESYIYALILEYAPGLTACPVLLTSIGLAILLAAIAYRVTGSAVAAAMPPLVLLFSTTYWSQSGYLPLYAGFVLFGYAGLYLAVEWLARPTANWRMVAGCLLIVVALNIYTTALVFAFIPALACLCLSTSWKRLALLYAVLLCAASPWIGWHLVVGGVSRLYYQPLDWFTVKYLSLVNAQFWGYEKTSVPSYARQMGEVGMFDILPPEFAVFVALGVWYVAHRLGVRAAVFAVSSIALYVLILAVTRPAPFARYYFPILPMVVLLAAGGVYAVYSAVVDAASRHSQGRQAIVRLASIALLAVVPLMSLFGYPPASIAVARHSYVGRLDTSTGYTDLLAMSSMIRASDGGVIGRDAAIQTLIPHNQAYTHFLLDEHDYVTYLMWKDDPSVIEMFHRQNIDWVLMRNDITWERDYNLWLRPAYGSDPQHYLRVAESPYFELAYQGQIYTLYHLRG